jgi:repressor LexA
MTSSTLTERQGQILSYLKRFVLQRGYPPTHRQIGDHFGIGSTNGVVGHLKALEKKWFIRREPMISRGITIVGFEVKA